MTWQSSLNVCLNLEQIQPGISNPPLRQRHRLSLDSPEDRGSSKKSLAASMPGDVKDYSSEVKWRRETGIWHQRNYCLSIRGMAMNQSCWGTEGYTTVQTVFRVVSNLTAFASVGFKFVSYIGFSNDACPLLFSCPA